MNILVIGSGGREHAILQKISLSAMATKLYVTGGTSGTKHYAEVADVKESDFQAIADFCQTKRIDLVIPGGETPLVAGITDYLTGLGIMVFGPSKMAAKIEGSKAYMKEIAVKYGIATAKYAEFTNYEDAISYIQNHPCPIVIKTDGLAAGKGVIIAESKEIAAQEISQIFGGKFGEAGKKIIIEEFLTGTEASFFVLCDGSDFIVLGSAEDHKRAFDGDTGLNTGGMGAYSPAKIMDDDLQKKITEQIIKPFLQAMQQEGHQYKGILFAGLMVKDGKPKLLEFNCRLGDPEAQVILPRVKSDLLPFIIASIKGQYNGKSITEMPLEISTNTSICVVMASKGYPQDYKKDTMIKLPDDVMITANNRRSDEVGDEASDEASDKLGDEASSYIYHSATYEDGGKLYSNGGRVLGIFAEARNLAEAQKIAYQKLAKIDWPHGFYRTDIGNKGL